MKRYFLLIIEAIYGSMRILASLFKSPIRSFLVIIIQPLCLLLLSTSILDGFLTFPHFPAEEVTRKILVYTIAFAGIMISCLAKYNIKVSNSFKNKKTPSGFFLSNLVIMAMRVLIFMVVIKIAHIQSFEMLYLPPACMLMFQA